MGGSIVGCQILGRVISPITKRTVRYLVQELHSTKGWRPRSEASADRFPFPPPVGAFCWSRGCGPKPPPAAVDPRLMNPNVLLRHGWYRRKLRKEAEERVKLQLQLQLQS